MISGNHTVPGALLVTAAVLLVACEGPGTDAPEAPSLDEQSALQKAEAMIEDNRDRIENEQAEGGE